MAKQSAQNIREYLETVVKEQEELEEKERRLGSEGASQASGDESEESLLKPAQAGEASHDDVNAVVQDAKGQEDEKAPESPTPVTSSSKPTQAGEVPADATSAESVEKQPIAPSTGPSESSSQATPGVEAPSGDTSDATPVVGVQAQSQHPEEPVKEKHPQRKTPQERAQELLHQTEDVVKKYSPAFVEQNLDQSKLALSFLEKAVARLPYSIDFETRGRIERNLEVMRELVSKSEQTIQKREYKEVLEEYLLEMDKALRRYTRQQIAKDPERAQYDYNLLFERKKELPEGNPTYEMIVSKRLSEFERRILSVVEGERTQEVAETLDDKMRQFLSQADKKDYDTLHSEYQDLVSHYNVIEDKLDKNELAKTKNQLYRCKEKLVQSRTKYQDERQRKRRESEEKQKEEYLGVRTFWKEYLRDLRVFTETVNAASPAQYFSLYEKYQSLLEMFYNLVRNDMISKEEAQQATQILEFVERRLEALRQSI